MKINHLLAVFALSFLGSKSLPALELNLAKGQPLPKALGLSANHHFETTHTVTTPLGVTKEKKQQFFQHIPIYNYHIVQSQDATSNRVTGQIAFIKDGFSTAATITPNTALKALSIRYPTSSVTGNKAIKLVILMAQSIPRLVYRVSYLSEQSQHISRPTGLVDAHTGELIRHWDELMTIQPTSSAISALSTATGSGGNEKVGEYYYGSDFDPLSVSDSNGRCSLENTNVKTVNMDNATFAFWPQAYSFTCPENSYQAVNGAFSPLNDAHFFGQVTFDMYSNWYQTAPLNRQLQMRVHYGRDYENAFWDGSTMTFGDGKDRFYPLVSLDVVAHEVSHGFTEQHSGLEYRNQSGGINEAFSDIAGEVAKYYLHGKNDWQVGYAITKGNGALRYLADPTLDENSIRHADDYTTGMNVHYSSGVFNHAFYLLAQTNGWDTRKAFDVFVLANQLYWTRTADYNQAACGVIQATVDLGYTTQSVSSAFAAVGVSCPS